MNAIRRTINPVVRVVDEARGLVDYIASDETVDSYKEVIRADGWRFTNFSKNAPFVDSHHYNSIDKLLGRVVDFQVVGRKLIERVQWAIDVPENELAQLGWRMTVGGYLRAVSVGCIPIRSTRRFQDGQKFEQALSALKLPEEQANSVQTIYLEQEQIELSACLIGANPNALAKAYRDGLLSQKDVTRLKASPSFAQGLSMAAQRFERSAELGAKVQQDSREVHDSLCELQSVLRMRVLGKRRNRG